MTGRPIATPLWSAKTRAESVDLLERLLGDAGDTTRQRLFRMNVTLCLHRAINDSEYLALPDWFWTDPATDLAGGPVEVIWETEPGSPSTQPCEHPAQMMLDPRDLLLWVPGDCGGCESCRARAAIAAEGRVSRR